MAGLTGSGDFCFCLDVVGEDQFASLISIHMVRLACPSFIARPGNSMTPSTTRYCAWTIVQVWDRPSNCACPVPVILSGNRAELVGYVFEAQECYARAPVAGWLSRAELLVEFRLRLIHPARGPFA